MGNVSAARAGQIWPCSSLPDLDLAGIGENGMAMLSLASQLRVPLGNSWPPKTCYLGPGELTGPLLLVRENSPCGDMQAGWELPCGVSQLLSHPLRIIHSGNILPRALCPSQESDSDPGSAWSLMRLKTAQWLSSCTSCHFSPQRSGPDLMLRRLTPRLLVLVPVIRT